ncbi:MAG: hypothetical protein ACLPIX_08940, partial [Rhodomicrobium sp.]
MLSIEVPLISPIAFMKPRLTQNLNAVHGAVLHAPRVSVEVREDDGGIHARRGKKSIGFYPDS